MDMEIIMGLAKKLMEYAAQFSSLYPFRTHVSCVVFGHYNLQHRDRTDSDKQTTLRVYVSELEIQKLCIQLNGLWVKLRVLKCFEIGAAARGSPSYSTDTNERISFSMIYETTSVSGCHASRE